MHPSREILKSHVSGQIAHRDEAASVDDHVRKCEFCREFCEDYALLVSSTNEAGDLLPSGRIDEAVDHAYRGAVRGFVVNMRAFPHDEPSVTTVLAADGEGSPTGGIENIATLYSDNPELVLRLMRNTDKGTCYLQLIGADKSFTSHVLVRAEDLGLDLLTDESGRADLDETAADRLSRAKWQIKMPEAVFSLKRQEYDPDRTEYEKEILLETDHGDRIEVRFEGKTDGKQISLKVVELDGQEEFGPVRIHVKVSGKQESATAGPEGVAKFELTDEDGSIDIRLFQL